MSVRKWVLSLIAASAILATGLTLFILNPFEVRANHGSALHNATDKKDVGAWGSFAVIYGTNPNLHGGQWTYNRTAVCKTVSGFTCAKFGEIGWWKKSPNTFNGLIVWDDGIARKDKQFFYFAFSNSEFVNQYNANTGKYDWFYDTQYIVSANLGFSQTDMVFCGGEVATGVEGMGATRCTENKYLDQSSGGAFVPWNGHVNYVDDAPYTNPNIDANSFKSQGNE